MFLRLTADTFAFMKCAGSLLRIDGYTHYLIEDSELLSRNIPKIHNKAPQFQKLDQNLGDNSNHELDRGAFITSVVKGIAPHWRFFADI